MMPKVARCNVANCAFHQNNGCHAPAITVGDAKPICDTFVESTQKAGEPEAVGSVGACKVRQCEHNQRMECTASRIVVASNGAEPTCTTYEPKMASVSR